MYRKAATITLVALAVFGSSCGTETAVSTAAPSTTLASPTTSPVVSTAESTTSSSTSADVTDFQRATWDDRHVVVYGNYATENTSAIRYLAASSDDVADLVDDSRRILEFDLPFGVKVRNGQIDISDGPNFPAPRVMWPVECLGVAPDVDGDALLDDCDPYPTDGPLADWDNDGVINPTDNCPTVFNPEQAVIGERSSGEACDVREGIGPEVWVVVPTVSLDDWNIVRAERGLHPLLMPTSPAPLPAEVADWCAAAFGDPNADLESLEQLASAIPDAYGLTLEQRIRLAELATRQSTLLLEYEVMQEADVETLIETAGSLEQVTADFVAIEEDAQAIQRQIELYLAPVIDSDLACDLER